MVVPNYPSGSEALNNDIINDIKDQKLCYFDHISRISIERVVKKVYKCNPISTRPEAYSKIVWEDDTVNDFRAMKTFIKSFRLLS